MKFELLADNKDFIPTIADWYSTEWGHLSKNNTVEGFKKSLLDYLNSDQLPLIVVAKQSNKPLGVCQLKFHEMDIYTDKEHWLGGVYVAEQYRGRHIAEKMIHEALAIAPELGVCKLYLQTERLDGGLYKRLGWQAIEQVNYHGIDVLVMERDVEA